MVVWLHFLRGVTFFSCSLDIGQKARPVPVALDPVALFSSGETARVNRIVLVRD